MTNVWLLVRNYGNPSYMSVYSGVYVMCWTKVRLGLFNQAQPVLYVFLGEFRVDYSSIRSYQSVCKWRFGHDRMNHRLGCLVGLAIASTNAELRDSSLWVRFSRRAKCYCFCNHIIKRNMYVCYELAHKYWTDLDEICHRDRITHRLYLHVDQTFYLNIMFPWDNFRLICGRSRRQELVCYKIPRSSPESAKR